MPQAELTATSSSVAMGHYARVLRRRAVWVVAGLVGGVALATAYYVALPTSATASSVVNVEIITTQPFELDRAASGLFDAATEATLAGSYTTAVRAAEKLGDSVDAASVRDASTISVDPDGTILRVHYTSPDARDAQLGADAVASAYLELRQERALARVAQTTAQIDERLAALGADLEDALTRLGAAAPGGTDAANAEADRQLARSEMDSLVASRTALRGVGGAVGSIVSPAVESSVTIEPSRSLVLAAGGLAGLATGVLLAFWVDGRDRRVRRLDDLADITTAPAWSPERDRGRHPTPSFEAVGEMLAAVTASTHSVAVISAVPPQIERAVVAALAAALAAAGRDSVVLDDVGARHRTRHGGHARHVDEVLELIVVGSDEGRAAQLGAAREASCVLLLVEIGWTDRAPLASLVAQLDQLDRPVIGSVVVDGRTSKALRAADVAGRSATPTTNADPVAGAATAHDQPAAGTDDAGDTPVETPSGGADADDDGGQGDRGPENDLPDDGSDERDPDVAVVDEQELVDTADGDPQGEPSAAVIPAQAPRSGDAEPTADGPRVTSASARR